MSGFTARACSIWPTLALYGLPAGADMDGCVLTAAFEEPPEIAFVPSWEDMPGSWIPLPPPKRWNSSPRSATSKNRAPTRSETWNARCAKLRYNLLEAPQDANRHGDAIGVARDLCARDPDEQRYAQKRFLSCQALGFIGEMREIVDDMAGPRRSLFEEAGEKMKPFRELAAQRFDGKKAAAGETPDEEERQREIAYELIRELPG